MNRFLLLVLVPLGLYSMDLSDSDLLAKSCFLKSTRVPAKNCAYKRAEDWILEGKVAYFYPTGRQFRQIYGGGAEYNLEFSRRLWKPIYIFTSVGYFPKTGQSIGLHSKSEIFLIPVEMGLKWMFAPINFITVYAGLGVNATYLHTHDYSKYVAKIKDGWGWGGSAKTGALFYVYKGLFVDLFADYTFETVYPRRSMSSGAKTVYYQSTNISGFSGGLGLGYSF